MISNASVPITNQQKLEATEEQLIQFLRDHNEVEMILPVIIGVLVTSRFQLRGTNALLVNLAVASVSRQIFTNLKNITPVATNSVSSATTTAPETEPNSKYSIVHSVPGRVRIKIPQIAEDKDFSARLQRLLDEDDHVTHVRINRAAASVVIGYDPQGLSDLELGLRLLSIMNNAEENEQ
ncbi:MAG: HMA2 domain-containing protein [Crocosphaera sp.]